MRDGNVILQILGSLMQRPQYLSETDKYNLTPQDFSSTLEKYIFLSIFNLYHDGAQRINPIDIENYLSSNQGAIGVFNKNNGLEFLQDADELADAQNFSYYYKKLKKINLLNSLKRNGIDTSSFYIDDFLNPKSDEINRKFEELTITDILNSVKQKLLKIEGTFLKNDTTETASAFDNIEKIISDAKLQVDVGYPIQGDYFNVVASGARKGTLYIRSGSSGVSKSRQAVGDACYLAFPIRYDECTCEWIQQGSNQKVLFVATEQTIDEIQKMILAYLTGFNESKFRYGDFSSEETIILKQAVWVMEQYKDNFYIVSMPNPNIELMKNIIRENVLLHDIEYVFYDYIFISPSLLNEFKGFNLRNDEILLLFATALKDIAVELDVFVMTSTQVNANADDNNNIRNEASIAGSRAIINKADLGCIMARPSKEELTALENLDKQYGIIPNIVTDIYKVRSGEWNQIRIWSFVDFGNLRKKDLFVTDARLGIVNITRNTFQIDWDDEDFNEISRELELLKDGDKWY